MSMRVHVHRSSTMIWVWCVGGWVGAMSRRIYIYIYSGRWRCFSLSKSERKPMLHGIRKLIIHDRETHQVYINLGMHVYVVCACVLLVSSKSEWCFNKHLKLCRFEYTHAYINIYHRNALCSQCYLWVCPCLLCKQFLHLSIYYIYRERDILFGMCVYIWACVADRSNSTCI